MKKIKFVYTFTSLVSAHLEKRIWTDRRTDAWPQLLIYKNSTLKIKGREKQKKKDKGNVKGKGQNTETVVVLTLTDFRGDFLHRH